MTGCMNISCMPLVHNTDVGILHVRTCMWLGDITCTCMWPGDITCTCMWLGGLCI